jgi:hypothetical protein
MRRSLAAIACLALAAAAPAVHAAGLDLTLDGCNTGTGVQTLAPACGESSTLFSIVGCFQLATDVAGVMGLDLALDVEVEGLTLPDFWMFDACNATGVTFSVARPATGCDGAAELWGAGGGEADFTRAYLSRPNGLMTRGRLVASIDRIADPVDVAAGTNQFAFELQLSVVNASESGGACAGCATPIVVSWTSAEVRSIAEAHPAPIPILGAGLTGRCVRLSGADPMTCLATPARNLTWGRLKALYR